VSKCMYLTIDLFHFLAGCCRRRLNQCLVVTLDFSVIISYGMFFGFFGIWVHVLFNLVPNQQAKANSASGVGK